MKAVFDKGGWAAANALYRNPPSTTEQVLHHEKFFAHEKARQVKVPHPGLG